ncbi:epoxyqueuosine reductase [Clostridium estertheticum]|uniref:Epoxyqueuosine reductase n=1 Tax=Clostridium estertheticum TaxID=238834 RepID=A0AA47EG88_9CLOT|nr:epoxyqueuosine reductase [Clostridium estertheticum]MBU3156330.1 epoxyqueuosine reductase [Clostridium estertheticum]MBU3200129.1 epoxyqueuosine reductase [Clostridium estertheticum]MCB2354894.1 epoxyqueuosine reductase [Clostridium estertheticum]MCB2359682.1 epoxyqueuosine reductase [Clostridium estertheticum]WAG41134.1 epoxyqueuosine reductase [Clostridium estertheticum]
METIEQIIQKKAYELGYEKCGIIPINLMEGYAEKFEERMQKVPESRPFYQSQQRLVNPLEVYPWAKSVVVFTSSYGKYRIPKEVKGHIAKSYLFDVRVDTNTKEYQNNRALEKYLQELGLKVGTNQKFGVVGMRWAAMQAKIGIIRRNNFLYTESGSWVHLEAWVTDREMELKETNNISQCPKGCNRCMASCPTKSLSDPYTMLPNTCISFLTTFGGRNLHQEPLSKTFGDCIYGCDICQDACPMNAGKLKGVDEFPGLAELAPELTPENILNMEEDFYREKVQPKFFYLSPEELWKWKVDVLNYMRNNYTESYKPLIINACKNKNEKICEMANSICNELCLQ